jgi:hypothetical protein
MDAKEWAPLRERILNLWPWMRHQNVSVDDALLPLRESKGLVEWLEKQERERDGR